MAPIVPALAQSESKARFFARLGLDPGNPTHKRVYALMKMEAAEGRRRLMEAQDSDTAQIHEAAWRQEVLRIFNEARTETKAVYNFGHNPNNGGQPDNWIIRWTLWHVFRYRDYRNRGRPRTSSPEPAELDQDSSDENQIPETPDGPSPPPPGASAEAPSGTPADGRDTPSNHFWDPIRNS